jgi:hypothetical protein
MELCPIAHLGRLNRLQTGAPFYFVKGRPDVGHKLTLGTSDRHLQTDQICQYKRKSDQSSQPEKPPESERQARLVAGQESDKRVRAIPGANL